MKECFAGSLHQRLPSRPRQHVRGLSDCGPSVQKSRYGKVARSQESVVPLLNVEQAHEVSDRGC